MHKYAAPAVGWDGARSYTGRQPGIGRSTSQDGTWHTTPPQRLGGGSLGWLALRCRAYNQRPESRPGSLSMACDLYRPQALTSSLQISLSHAHSTRRRCSVRRIGSLQAGALAVSRVAVERGYGLYAHARRR